MTKSGVTKLEAFTPDHMKEVNGVTPTEFIDMKALMGDPSDNYPGVAKVGPKTASKLIQEYGSVENLYDQVDEMKKSKLKENLIAGKDNALLGKKLATINCDSPVEVTLDDLSYEGSNIDDLRRFYEKMNFRRFLADLAQKGELTENKTEVKKQDYVVLSADNLDQLPKAAEVTFYLAMFGDNYHLGRLRRFCLENRRGNFRQPGRLPLAGKPLEGNAGRFCRSKERL